MRGASNRYNGVDGQTSTNGTKSEGKRSSDNKSGGSVGSQVSAITQVPVTMEGLIQVGCHGVVLGQG